MPIQGNPRFQALNPNTGALGAGYKLYFYVAGTSTPTDAYSDQALTTALANPAIANAAGELTVFLDPAVAYKLVLKTEADSVVWTIDSIQTAEAGAFTTISASGQITSTVATGTAPLVIASTTKVANLNADQVDGGDWAAPGAALGTGTRVPSTSNLTNVDLSGTLAVGGATTLTGAVSANGSITLATGKTATLTDADSLIVGSKIIAQTWTKEFYLFGTMVDAHMWIAHRACKVVSVKEIHSVVGGAACVIRPRKITDTSAPGAAASSTVKEITQADFDGTSTINTTVTGTLSATASDYTFATGDKLSLNVGGTMTGLVGIIVVEFQAV